MGHSPSAVKRERQNLKRHIANRDSRSTLRRELKRINATIVAGTATPKETLSAGFKALDRAARKNAIPKKRADRKKSRMALALNRAVAAKAK